MKEGSTNHISIAINASMLDEKPTGVGTYSFHLINCLAAALKSAGNRRHLTVFTPVRKFINSGVDIKKLPAILQSSRYGKLAAFARFFWNTFIYPFQSGRFDIFISPTTHGSFVLNRQIITIHDLISLHFNNISFHQRVYFKYLLPLLLRRAQLIIAVSENTKKDIVHFFGIPENKILVVYNGYDDTSFFQADNAKKIIASYFGCSNYFLAVGPTYPHKNFERLIEAYSALDEDTQKRHPLLIAGGKKAYVRVLQDLVHKKNLSTRVVFTGYISSAMMPTLYREAFALIFPSLYEGFGIPLLEAMASGCPVISSNTASMPEVCENAALYFDPLSTSSLTAAMEAMTNDVMLRRQYIASGLIQCQKFSWQKMADEFHQIIQTSITNKKTVVQ